jgi:hypothetical protein
VRKSTGERLRANQHALYVSKRLADVLEKVDRLVPDHILSEKRIVTWFVDYARTLRVMDETEDVPAEVQTGDFDAWKKWATPALEDWRRRAEAMGPERVRVLLDEARARWPEQSWDETSVAGEELLYFDENQLLMLALPGTCGVEARFLVKALAAVRARAEKTGKRKAYLVAAMWAWRQHDTSAPRGGTPKARLAAAEADVKQNLRREISRSRRRAATPGLPAFLTAALDAYASLLSDAESSRRWLRERGRYHLGLSRLAGSEPPNGCTPAESGPNSSSSTAPRRKQQEETRCRPPNVSSRPAKSPKGSASGSRPSGSGGSRAKAPGTSASVTAASATTPPTSRSGSGPARPAALPKRKPAGSRPRRSRAREKPPP